MKLWVVIAVFIIFPTIHGLVCINYNDALEMQLAKFDRENLRKQLDRLSVNQDKDLCRVLIVIGYAAQVMNVKFTKLLENSLLPIGEIQFTNFFKPDTNGKIRLINAFEYACSNYDGCDKKFVLDHIEWLLKTEYTDFLQNIIRLTVGQNKPSGKCRDSHETLTVGIIVTLDEKTRRYTIKKIRVLGNLKPMISEIVSQTPQGFPKYYYLKLFKSFRNDLQNPTGIKMSGNSFFGFPTNRTFLRVQ